MTMQGAMPRARWMAACLMASAVHVKALHPYGHAYSRPNDFTPDQFRAIASRFPVFTVEKNHAANEYGNKSASPPFSSNSIAATIGTARKIKAINSTVKVLMYWNSELHFNFYECESDVQPSWLMHHTSKKPPFYNYSVADFRTWWVKCAVNAVRSSEGMLDGIFIDATPKVATSGIINAMEYWGTMVDQIKTELGPEAFVVNNGYYLSPTGVEITGEDAWSHTDITYVERMAAIGTSQFSTNTSLQYLNWLADSAAAHPDRLFIGHGSMATSGSDDTSANFVAGLANYLLVTSSEKRGYFLANNGSYSITGGLLNQPTGVYNGGLGCGEPLGKFRQLKVGEFSLRREFENGSVEVDLTVGSATIKCGNGFWTNAL